MRGKPNWVGHTLRRNCLIHDAVEEQMTEVKILERSITQIRHGLGNRRRHWELKEEAEDGNDSSAIAPKEEIQIIFHNSNALLTGTILNNNNN